MPYNEKYLQKNIGGLISDSIQRLIIKDLFKSFGYDGIIYKNAVDRVVPKEVLDNIDWRDYNAGIRTDSDEYAKVGEENYIVFDSDQLIPAEYDITNQLDDGIVKLAIPIPRDNVERNLDIFEQDLVDVESFYDLDLELPEPLVSNRAERQERHLRDFEILAKEELPDWMRYDIIAEDGQYIAFIFFDEEPKAQDFKDIRDVSDRSGIKIQAEDRSVLPRQYIRRNGLLEYRPVRGRHIETLKLSELRTLAKEMGLSTADMDFTNMEAVEKGYTDMGISSVLLEKILFNNEFDKQYGDLYQISTENRYERNYKKLLARMESALDKAGIKDNIKLNPNSLLLEKLALTAEYPTDIDKQMPPNRSLDSGSLRPAFRTAVQRSGIVPDIGQEHYETIKFYNRARFLNTRQELINRIKAEGKEFIPRKVQGLQASIPLKKAESDLEQNIKQLEADKTLLKKFIDLNPTEKNEFMKKKLLLEKLQLTDFLHGRGIGLANLRDVLEPSGSNFAETYRIGKEILAGEDGEIKQGETIYATVMGRRVYYFKKFRMPFHGEKKIQIYFRTDESGSMILNPITGAEVQPITEDIIQFHDEPIIKRDEDGRIIRDEDGNYVTEAYTRIPITHFKEFVEKNSLGFTVKEAKLGVRWLNMEQKNEGLPIKEYERFKGGALGAKKLNKDDFGLYAYNKAGLIHLMKELGISEYEDLRNRFGSEKIQSINSILENMTDSALRSYIRNHLKKLQREAIAENEEIEEYATILEDDYNIKRNSVEGRRLLRPSGRKEMKELANDIKEKKEKAEKESREDELDYDDFLDYINKVEKFQQERKQEGGEQGALTKDMAERAYQAYTGEEIGEELLSNTEKLNYRNVLDRINMTYPVQDVFDKEGNLVERSIRTQVDLDVKRILSDASRGLHPHLSKGVESLTLMKVRMFQLEDLIDGYNQEITYLYEQVEMGAGANHAVIEIKIAELRTAQAELRGIIEAHRYVSHHWGKLGVAMRMSRSTHSEFDVELSKIIEEAYENYNMGKDKTEELPSNVMQSLSKLVSKVKEVDERIDEVTERRNTEVWNDETKNANVWITEIIKTMGNKRKFISKVLKFEDYFSKEELDKFETQQEKLEQLREKIISLIHKIREVEQDADVKFSLINAQGYDLKDPVLRRYVRDLTKYYLRSTIVHDDINTLEELLPYLQNDLSMFTREELIHLIADRVEPKSKKKFKTQYQKVKTVAVLQDKIREALNGISGRKVTALSEPDIIPLRNLLRIYKNLIVDVDFDNQKTDQILERIERIENGIENVVRPNVPKRIKQDTLIEAEGNLRDLIAIKNIEAELEKWKSIQNEKDPNTFIDRWEAVSIISRQDKSEKSEALKELIYERKKLRDEINREVDAIKFNNMNWKNKVGYYAWEALGIPRGLMAMMDWSYFLRQGLMSLYWNPIGNKKYGRSGIKIGGETFVQAWRAFNEADAALIDAGLRGHPLYNYMTQEMGISFTRWDGKPTDREERFINNLLNKELKLFGVDINIAGKISRTSERNMVTGLNLLRFKIAEQFIQCDMGKNSSLEQKRAFADYVNTMTGRQKFKGEFMGQRIDLEPAIAQLAQVTFSPRFAASRIILPHSAVQKMFKHPELAPLIMGQWLSYGSMHLTIYALAYLGADDEDREKMSPERFFNPFDSHFGYISVNGYMIDMWGGNMQPLRLQARLLLGAFNTDWAGENKFWDVNSSASFEMQKFFWNKGSPQLRLSWELAFKENPAYGSSIDWTEEWDEKLRNYFTPFSSQLMVETAGDAINDELSFGTAVALPALEMSGISINKWESSGKRNSRGRKINNIQW